MPDALSAVAESLPPTIREMPIVANYLIDQRSRVSICERVASQAVNRFRSKRATTRSNPATADTYDASSHLRQLAPGTTVDSDAAARAVSDAASDQADTPDQSTLKADIIAC